MLSTVHSPSGSMRFGAELAISGIVWLYICGPVNGSHYSATNCGAPKTKTKRKIAWKIDIPKMCLTIFWEMIYSFFLYGGLSKRLSFGASVARAREARESMIRLTHKS